MNINLDHPIAKRKTKTVYKDNDKTIKLFIEKYSKVDILNEALNQSRVEEGTDLHIPKLIEICKINNRWALVFEHIEGTTLEELMSKNPDKMDEYMNLFVDIQLEISKKSVPLLNRIKEKYRRKLTESSLIDENTKYELLQRLEGMKSNSQLCHGDFNPSNIVIKENGEHYILDWAHVTKGDEAADCARTFLLFSLDGKEELAEKYLNLFSEKSGVNKKDIQRWIPIVAATHLKKDIEKQELLRKWIDVVDYE